jgi:hypothetical protein
MQIAQNLIFEAPGPLLVDAREVDGASITSQTFLMVHIIIIEERLFYK